MSTFISSAPYNSTSQKQYFCINSGIDCNNKWAKNSSSLSSLIWHLFCIYYLILSLVSNLEMELSHKLSTWFKKTKLSIKQNTINSNELQICSIVHHLLGSITIWNMRTPKCLFRFEKDIFIRMHHIETLQRVVMLLCIWAKIISLHFTHKSLFLYIGFIDFAMHLYRRRQIR